MSEWPGRAAFVLALGVSVGWATALIIAASPATDPISEAGANLLSTIGGAMVGAVAAYLGIHVGRTGTDRPIRSRRGGTTVSTPTPADRSPGDKPADEVQTSTTTETSTTVDNGTDEVRTPDAPVPAEDDHGTDDARDDNDGHDDDDGGDDGRHARR